MNVNYINVCRLTLLPHLVMQLSKFFLTCLQYVVNFKRCPQYQVIAIKICIFILIIVCNVPFIATLL